MRVVAVFLCFALGTSVLAACGSDGTNVNLPRDRGALFGGSGAPGEAPAGEAALDAGTTAPVVGTTTLGGGDTQVTPDGGAAVVTTTPENDAAATDAEATRTGDGAVVPNVTGCACGCTDPCLTELITDCKAPTPELLLVCPKVPATCACETSCAAPPAEPSLTQCIAQFLLTGT